MKSCLAYANVGPAILVRLPSDFINFTGKLKLNIGAAREYALGTGHNVTRTKHITLVSAKELNEDCPMLQLGGGQDVPSYKAAAKQRRVNNDVSLYNWKN
jgi:hypothetical protein